jgi:hypothetical protein
MVALLNDFSPRLATSVPNRDGIPAGASGRSIRGACDYTSRARFARLGGEP